MKFKTVEPSLITAQGQQMYKLVSTVDTEFLYVEGLHCATYYIYSASGNRQQVELTDFGIVCSLRDAVDASKHGDITDKEFSEHEVIVELPAPFGFKNSSDEIVRYYTEEQVQKALEKQGVGLVIRYSQNKVNHVI